MKEKEKKNIYRDLPPLAKPAEAEAEVLKYWDDYGIFGRSLEKRSPENPFVFYEGPPTANGRPGVHHAMSRTIKDTICRFKTMRGYRVERKAGWDTHGLPVEIEVEKKLGLDGKEQIEEHGVEDFNRECRKSIFKYLDEWHEFTRMLGFWLDLDNPYVTCTNEYIESVWWILKQFWNKNLLYEGHKIVPYCSRCGTSLSSHEVSQGYKEVKDPSIYFKLPLKDEEASFLVWTTTPWTLLSNVALAVGPEYKYVKVKSNGEILILAEALTAVLGDEFEVLDRFDGKELVGKEYKPCFPYFEDAKGAFRVIAGDFVTLADGTGIVHIAPAFGEDDYKVGEAENLPFVQPVDKKGRFTEDIEPWPGVFVKDCDPEIIADLNKRGILYRSGEIEHSYPFCWRCDSPLLYYGRRSWYIKTTAFKDKLIEANSKIEWFPPEVGENRFARWLEGNVDWALSRERYWGTPLNIWICNSCGEKFCPAGVEELKEVSGNFPEDYDLHKPFVDELDVSCPQCGASMKRVPDVIDCWFDSGAMPFAQHHYPFENKDVFENQYPAEFISEGVDQSRGWFYSLLVIGVFLKKESPYRRCLPHGMVLDANGRKMSKSRGNAVFARDALNTYGADALRWFLMTSGAPHLAKRFDTDSLKDSANRFIGTFKNLYSFFAMYARLDGFVPAGEIESDNLIDKWLLSVYNSTIKEVTEALDAYDINRAGRKLSVFAVDQLSNWYLRRCRRRFWKNEMSGDKRAAYETYYMVLSGLTRLMAPIVPFISESVYLRLNSYREEEEGNLSVHLQDYPEYDEEMIDGELERKMREVLQVVIAGRAARNKAGIKVRTPLSELLVSNASSGRVDWLDDQGYTSLVHDELNVKKISYAESADDYILLTAKPEYSLLGKRFGKKIKEVSRVIEELPSAKLKALESDGEIFIDIEGKREKFISEEIKISRKTIENFEVEEESDMTVVLNTELTPELIREGIARDLVNRIQNLRKDSDFEISDRIVLSHESDEEIEEVFAEFDDYIRSETLTESISRGKKDWPFTAEFELNDLSVKIWTKLT
ncbi:MAG: isoleucine--tRNA ligase [Candidatus Krumholzibacteriota bacterium]|nr:isoleucine--tRNA ligase [Candidatus Krumholzibacteriota bacterium]